MAITPVLLPNKMSLAVKEGAPVPPLETGRMPEMEEDKEMGETYKLPEEVV